MPVLLDPGSLTDGSGAQTSQLPKDDRISVSFKEYLAEIDVCMGGRVAEELSEWGLSEIMVI